MNQCKRATVTIPTITPSNFTVQLRKKNKQLIKDLERLENGPFRMKKWFAK